MMMLMYVGPHPPLTVAPPLPRPTEAPEIVDANSTKSQVSVRSRENVTLTCAARGVPEPTIQWTREDGQPLRVAPGHRPRHSHRPRHRQHGRHAQHGQHDQYDQRAQHGQHDQYDQRAQYGQHDQYDQHAQYDQYDQRAQYGQHGGRRDQFERNGEHGESVR